MSIEMHSLTAVARELQQPLTLEELLQILVDRTARLLGVARVSVRLLDPTRQRLIARCRSGDPLHLNPITEFSRGEGLVGWVAEHAQPLSCPDAEADPRFVRRGGMHEAIGAFLGVPLMAGDRCVGVLSAVQPQCGFFSSSHLQALTLLAAMCGPHIEVARLSRLMHVDPLTGTLNRRGLDLALPDATAPAGGMPRPLCVAMCDIDRFKQVNDRFGHAMGDEVLCDVAASLTSIVRTGDSVVRYGGEEFLLILAGIELARAERVVERARTTVELSGLGTPRAAVPVTLSFGLAERRPREPREQLLARADAALYSAKRQGRNRVVVAL